METSLFDLVFATGPLLVAVFVLVASPAAAIAASAFVTGTGTLVLCRSPVLRHQGEPGYGARTRRLGPLRVAGFELVLVCVGGRTTEGLYARIAQRLLAMASSTAPAARRHSPLRVLNDGRTYEIIKNFRTRPVQRRRRSHRLRRGNGRSCVTSGRLPARCG